MALEIHENNGGKVTMKDGFILHSGDYCLCADGGHIEIGSDVFIGKWDMIVAVDHVKIGDGTIIAERTSIRDHNHEYREYDRWIKHQGFTSKSIEIGEGCWIGANCLITAGSSMGKGSVLAGNSVLAGKHIPDYEIWGGNPAKFIKRRFEGENT